MEPFVPHPLPPENLDYGRLIGLVGRANAELARYDGLLQGVVNPAVLLSPLTTQEAVLSSKIEGTQATLDEVLEHEAGQSFSPEKDQDIREVVNYRTALLTATAELAHRQLSLSLVKEMHQMLMDSVRGANKEPGSFRLDQNWIGRPGCTMAEATFVPPSPLQLLDHLEAWERYLAFDDVDRMVQTAVVHAQFELIHPFKDGNGRIGRLLIPLFLYSKKALSRPMFYLSGYLETHRDEYYTRLRAISQEGDWDGWIGFFLEAVIAQALDNAEKVRNILALYEGMKVQVAKVTHSQYAIAALDAIFDRPVFRTSDFAARSGIPTRQTAMLILRQLQQSGILKTLQEASGQRPATLIFPALMNLAEGRRVV
ncbi:MAG: Fic family protein [Proteobacteria bacterium]|nr:Fic family protein [Desulfocapsa sp.]MBU3943663.1 Fic family protein [Pseudomonadota bacterium]MCG2742330.1 Fic family protein [Desulfobacteraceae bacterium]MBU4029923.1 Fic family protein [Pseudomonadota bacterium]MBU4042257.1 Fic family protein [Pseudomonadota bacterium]